MRAGDLLISLGYVIMLDDFGNFYTLDTNQVAIFLEMHCDDKKCKSFYILSKRGIAIFQGDRKKCFKLASELA